MAMLKETPGMTAVRRIRNVWKSQPTLEGAAVHLKRVFGCGQAPLVDPFLQLDDFHSGNPKHDLRGFPWRPHRGIETITYVHQGRVEHGDSMGNRGVIESGDIQWMTAGSGIIHQEMPKGWDDRLLWGFHLWANLPAAGKMMAPRCRGITAAQIPEASLTGDIKIKVICGEVAGMKGPAQDVAVAPEYLAVTVPAGTVFTHPVRRGHTVFAYVVDGEGYFDTERNAYAREMVGVNYFDLERRCVCGGENLILYGDGDAVTVTAQDRPVRFLLVSGRPLGEPVAWYGPIVMNTQEELQQAFAKYQAGTFLRHK